MCCPKPEYNLRDKVFADKYYKDGVAVANSLPAQCTAPLPTITGAGTDYFKCPLGIDCGAGWTKSTTTCHCCVDFAVTVDCTNTAVTELK